MKHKIFSILTAICLSAVIFSACENEDVSSAVSSAAVLFDDEETFEEESAKNISGKESVPDGENVASAEDVPDEENLAGEESVSGDKDALSGEVSATIDPDGTYTTKEDVALYLHTYGRLPANFITKSEARELGWSGGSLEAYAPGKCIGGDRFGNYEGILPDDNIYRECDINTLGVEERGAERLVYSDDGSIYYTDDHYETFTLLYGDE